MESFNELMELSIEELELKIKGYLQENKHSHDDAVLMGSLGVSPKYMNMYFDSAKAIKNMKE